MIGGWMSRVATGWLVFRLSESDPALMLGVIGFVGQGPAFLLSPFAGVMVDRWNRHRLLIATLRVKWAPTLTDPTPAHTRKDYFLGGANRSLRRSRQTQPSWPRCWPSMIRTLTKLVSTAFSTIPPKTPLRSPPRFLPA
jgi:hypothetical protein